MLNVEWFTGMPRELAVILISMIPIGELRAGIPIAIQVYDFPWWEAFVLSIIGNIVPIIFILWLLEPVSKWLMKKSKLFNRFFTWLFDRTRKKHTNKFERWGELALILFVAIPLPITGGWTGSVAAFVFGVPFRKALPLIFVGLLIAGVIVTLASLGVISFFV